jgi:hypothetical protein
MTASHRRRLPVHPFDGHEDETGHDPAAEEERGPPMIGPVSTTARSGDAATSARASTALFSSFAGLTSLVVLLQGLWAGLFVPVGKGGPYNDTWVNVHNWGGRVALLLALVTAIVGFVTMRARRELWIGAIVLVVLIALETGLGGAISDSNSGGAAAVHIPLALVIMALTVWLSLRARHAD